MNYKLNEEKMFVDITDGTAIIINSETGIYYGLNEFATSVYENIVNGAALEDILNYLKNIPQCPLDIENRLNNFIKSMLDFELIINDVENKSEVKLDINVAIEAKFELDVKAYDDAQELLLADPIHEVKEDTGWTPEKNSIGYTKEETREREKKMEQ